MAITEEFRRFANVQNQKAGGAQNAQLQVDFDIPSGRGGWESKCWRGTRVYLSGAHTERELIQHFWRDYGTLRFNGLARLRQVQVFTRFNACLGCTEDLVGFWTRLQGFANAGAALYDLADRGNVYLPHEGSAQISIPEGKFRKETTSTALRLKHWTVETQGPNGRIVQTLDTLGTREDPIVLA